MPTDKIALVTGANKGIGLATARQLAESGPTVLLGSRDAARGAEAAEELARSGVTVRLPRRPGTRPHQGQRRHAGLHRHRPQRVPRHPHRDEGARAAVHRATGGDDGDTGGFFADTGRLPW